MKFDLVDQLYIIALEEEKALRELCLEIVFSVIAIAILGSIFYFGILPRLKAMYKRSKSDAVIFSVLMAVGIGYGGTKRNAVSDFNVVADPDGITATWNEPDESVVVTGGILQRRILGATEDEAWEDIRFVEMEGDKRIRVDGFTLDKDYQYRLKYYYKEID